MKKLLTEALEIVKATEPSDIRTKARGRRAHARVLATISLARATAAACREQRIANLLILAQIEGHEADWALREAHRMLADDQHATTIGS